MFFLPLKFTTKYFNILPKIQNELLSLGAHHTSVNIGNNNIEEEEVMEKRREEEDEM